MFKDGVSQDQIKEYISQINNGGLSGSSFG